MANDSDILPYVVSKAPSNSSSFAAIEVFASADTSLTITGATSNVITLSEGKEFGRRIARMHSHCRLPISMVALVES